MEKRNIRFLYISLFIVSVGTLILAVANITKVDLPDWVTRTIGVIDLVMLLIVAYTTVKKLMVKKA